MTNQSSIAALLTLIHERQTFVISSHTRPDGDAIGSSLGLMHLLEALGKDVTVAFTDRIPGIFQCLPGVDRISPHLPSVAPEAAIFLECDSLERSSFDAHEFNTVTPALTINIDHHASGREFANFNWIDSKAPAVGAMIYDLVLASGVPLSTQIATCLYAAILTDTGSFAYAGVTASTFGMAEHLVEAGADPYLIAQAMFFSSAPARVRLLGAAFGKMQLENLQEGCGTPPRHFPSASEGVPQLVGQIAWCAITLDDMELAGAEIEDCEGIVSYLIGIAGVEAAVFMRELPSRTGFRLSLRSKGKLDIAGVAEQFGGGGHRNASGCSIEGSLHEVSHRVLSHLRSAFERLQANPNDHASQTATLLA
jgi:phosphoesterase RecJ-like protein